MKMIMRLSCIIDIIIYVHYTVTMLCHAHKMSSDPLLTHVKVLVSILKGEGHNIYQDRFLDPN